MVGGIRTLPTKLQRLCLPPARPARESGRLRLPTARPPLGGQRRRRQRRHGVRRRGYQPRAAAGAAGAAERCQQAACRPGNVLQTQTALANARPGMLVNQRSPSLDRLPQNFQLIKCVKWQLQHGLPRRLAEASSPEPRGITPLLVPLYVRNGWLASNDSWTCCRSKSWRRRRRP